MEVSLGAVWQVYTYFPCYFSSLHLLSILNLKKRENSEKSRPFSNPNQGAQALQSLTCPTSSTCNLYAFVGLMRLS